MPTDAMPQAQQLAQRSASSNDISITPNDYSMSGMPSTAPSYQPYQYQSLRARRQQQNRQLPLQFRRRLPMDNEPWMTQSMSDIEDESRLGRNFLCGMPSHSPLYSANAAASQSAHTPALLNEMYNTAQLSMGTGSSTNQSSPVWQAGQPQASFDGIASAPMSAVWPQNNGPAYFSDTSLSLPSTPAPVGLFQTSLQDQTSRQMPHLNTPPGSAISFAKHCNDGSERKPQLRLDTGSHTYFKENGSVIMDKFFNNNSTPIAPPQLYNIPPPTSLSSQDSFNDGSSVASGHQLRMTPVGLRQARSDLSSSQPSFGSGGDFTSQSPLVDHSTRRRLPTHASSSPSVHREMNAQPSTGYNSLSYATSAAPSVYESGSNYAGSSVQSSQPSRLPSPALSDSHRSAQNAFLIRARAKGMSYKEIKIQGGFTEAESTLRGRHRMLTKDKDDRVRKPEWTEQDVSPTKPKYPRIILKTHST